MSQSPRGAADRPLSPHMQVWRWHVTMFTSILHRASLIGLYAGLILLVGWALALASGEQAYGLYMGLLGSLLGRLVMFGLTFALFYNVASSVRHLVWDTGRGFALKDSEISSWTAIAFAILATLATWVLAATQGALS